MVKPMGPDAAVGHESGAGPLPANTPIEIDLWPRDERSGCWSDMTRAFVRGEISDAIAGIHELVLEAHERACAAVVGIRVGGGYEGIGAGIEGESLGDYGAAQGEGHGQEE